MLDWITRKIKTYTDHHHAGVVTITWDKFANNALAISWKNNRGRNSTSYDTFVSQDEISTIRDWQNLGAEVLGYSVNLPLGEFKVGVITTGGKYATESAIRVRDCNGDESDFAIQGNYLVITLPSNNVFEAQAFHNNLRS